MLVSLINYLTLAPYLEKIISIIILVLLILFWIFFMFAGRDHARISSGVMYNTLFQFHLLPIILIAHIVFTDFPIIFILIMGVFYSLLSTITGSFCYNWVPYIVGWNIGRVIAVDNFTDFNLILAGFIGLFITFIIYSVIHAIIDPF